MALLQSLAPDETQTYRRNGFDLNLSYILPNIIAMSCPRSKVESVLLNDVNRIRRFLDEKHGNHYFVYNLSSEIDYSAKKFHGRVARYPIKDYNPPPMEMMRSFCEDVDRWLTHDSRNVAVVHCHSGKGRTGTMICAYLLYKRFFDSADHALQFFHDQRMKNGVKALHPGAARYVRYFERLVKQRLIYSPKSLLLCAIEFSACPTLNGMLCSPCFTVRHSGSRRNYTSRVYSATTKRRKLLMHLPVPISVIGDVKVSFYDKQLGKRKLFWLWFNTAFVDGPSEVVVDDDVDVKADGWRSVARTASGFQDGSQPRPSCLTSVVNVRHQQTSHPRRPRRFLTLSFPQPEIDRREQDTLIHIVDINFKVKLYLTPTTEDFSA